MAVVVDPADPQDCSGWIQNNCAVVSKNSFLDYVSYCSELPNPCVVESARSSSLVYQMK